MFCESSDFGVNRTNEDGAGGDEEGAAAEDEGGEGFTKTGAHDDESGVAMMEDRETAVEEEGEVKLPIHPRGGENAEGDAGGAFEG